MPRGGTKGRGFCGTVSRRWPEDAELEPGALGSRSGSTCHYPLTSGKSQPPGALVSPSLQDGSHTKSELPNAGHFTPSLWSLPCLAVHAESTEFSLFGLLIHIKVFQNKTQYCLHR